MHAYREAPSPLPLVTCVAGVVAALAPESGALLWSTRLEKKVARAIVAGRYVFVATHQPGDRDAASEILLLEIDSGKQRSVVKVATTMTAAIVRGDRVYFAGPLGCVAFSAEGHVLWHVRADVTKRGTFNALRDLVGYDAAGHELWRVTGVAYGTDVFLALGDAVAQPDFERLSEP